MTNGISTLFRMVADPAFFALKCALNGAKDLGDRAQHFFECAGQSPGSQIIGGTGYLGKVEPAFATTEPDFTP